MSRNGKIARLPRHLREAINHRLANGEPGEPLLAWLNLLPEVQAILQDQFAGIPISKQNLHEWRKGGFAEWDLKRDLKYDTDELTADAEELDTEPDGSLADRLAMVLAAHYASLIRGWNGEATDEFRARHKALRGLVQDVSLLRRWDHNGTKVALALMTREDKNRQAHRQEIAELEAQSRKDRELARTLQHIMPALRPRPTASPSPSPASPPLDRGGDSLSPPAEQATTAESNPVKPSQTTFTAPSQPKPSGQKSDLCSSRGDETLESEPENPPRLPAQPPTPTPAEAPIPSHPVKPSKTTFTVPSQPKPSGQKSDLRSSRGDETLESKSEPENPPPTAIPSPCIGICKNDGGGHCTGCLRSIPEILRWPTMPPEQKRQCLEHLALRRRKKEHRE